MKRFFNVLIKIFIVAIVIFLILGILFVSIQSEKVPDIFAFTSNQQAKALVGNYKWNEFSEVRKQTNFTREMYSAKSENTLLVSPNERITIANSQNIAARRKFSQESFEYVDTKGNTTIVPYEAPSNAYGDRTYMEFTAPDTEDTYMYYFTLDYYEKGKVEYCLKIVVSLEPIYNISEIVKHNGIKITETDKIYSLLSTLPYSRNITNIAIDSTSEIEKILVHYSTISVDRENYINNAIAFFALIPELDAIEFSSSESVFYFTRDEINNYQGRDVTEYVDNVELWENEVLFKERVNDENSTKYKAVSKIINDIMKYESGEVVSEMSIDLASFDADCALPLDEVNKYKLISAVMEHVKTVFNISSSEYDSLKYKHVFVGVEKIEEPEPIPSGDNLVDNYAEANLDMGNSGDNEVYNKINIIVKEGKSESHYVYQIAFESGDWSILRVSNYYLFS